MEILALESTERAYYTPARYLHPSHPKELWINYKEESFFDNKADAVNAAELWNMTRKPATPYFAVKVTKTETVTKA